MSRKWDAVHGDGSVPGDTPGIEPPASLRAQRSTRRDVWLPLERCGSQKISGLKAMKVSQALHKSHLIQGGRLKTVTKVKVFGVLGYCVYKERSNAHLYGNVHCSHNGIPKQSLAKTLPLPSTIHSQPAQDHDRNRFRHIAPDSSRHFHALDASRGQGIIPGDGMPGGDDERAGSTGRFIAQRLSGQPGIEDINAAIKFRQDEPGADRFRMTKADHSSHGALVASSLRIFSETGACSAASNSVKASSSKKKRR